MERQLTEVFAKTCQLLAERGYKNLGKSEAVISEQIDDDWSISFNPTMDSITLESGFALPRMSVALDHKGFPVGVFDPAGGGMISSAENDYIAALDVQLGV